MQAINRAKDLALGFYSRIAGRDTIRHGSLLFVATATGSAALFFFHFLASRRLGVEAYGVLAALLAAVALISFTSTVGTTIVARFAAEFYALDDARRLRRLNDVVTMVCASIFICGCAVAAAFTSQLAAFFHVDTLGVVALTVILTTLGVVLALARGIQQGAHRFTSLSVSQIVESLGKAVLAAVAVFAGLGVMGALAGQIAASLAAALYTFADTRMHFTAPPEKLRFNLRRLLQTSGGIAGAFVGLAILINFDVVLAKHYLTSREAGLYAVATLPGRTLAGIMYFLPTIMLPKATANASVGKPAHKLLLGAFAVSAGVWLIALTIFYLVPVPIVHLIAGGAYTAAAPLVFPYGCSAAVFGLASIAVAYRIGHGNFGFVIPLLIVVSGELVAIAFVHATALGIIRILICANVLALLVSLYGITQLRRPGPARQADRAPEQAVTAQTS